MPEDADAKMNRYMSRPQASDVAAQVAKATIAARGFVCPKCHCCDTRVGTTRKSVNEVSRYRYCRACGTTIKTLEVAISAVHEQ